MFKDRLEKTMDSLDKQMYSLREYEATLEEFDQKAKELNELITAMNEARKAYSQLWFLFNRFTENKDSEKNAEDFIKVLRETQDMFGLYTETSSS